MLKRRPTIKPGQLRLWYGRLDGDSPDICGGWGGSGADKCDSHLMMGHFTSKRLVLVYGEERERLGRSYKFERSFVEELEARGYDISTIQFSIQRKVQPNPTSEPKK
jgi:hypothetical protein